MGVTSPQPGGPPPGARLVLVHDIARSVSQPGSIVAVLEKQWRVRALSSIRGWRGPSKKKEKFAREYLRPIHYNELLIDAAGFYDPV